MGGEFGGLAPIRSPKPNGPGSLSRKSTFQGQWLSVGFFSVSPSLTLILFTNCTCRGLVEIRHGEWICENDLAILMHCELLFDLNEERLQLCVRPCVGRLQLLFAAACIYLAFLMLCSSNS